MTRREAALILGVRERAKEEAIKDAHRKIMIANHPDAGKQCLLGFSFYGVMLCCSCWLKRPVAGGSSYLATKINEAKSILLGQKGRTSAF